MSSVEKVKDFLDKFFMDVTGNYLWSTEDSCTTFIEIYNNLEAEERAQVLLYLAQYYGLNKKSVLSTVNNAPQDDLDLSVLTLADKMRSNSKPRHAQLFSQVCRVVGGLKFLIDLRATVLSLSRQRTNTELENAYYQELNVCLRDLLAPCVTSSVLDLGKVTWASSCQLVQKVCEFEAVHPIESLQDMKRRVGPNRRCFVFTHKNIPGIPLVILHVALTPEISSCLHDLVDKPSILDNDNKTDKQPLAKTGVEKEKEDPTEIKAAIFYSITSTQRGLQGIEMGKHLIKAAVEQLVEEFPQISQFSSLSPIPGFRSWLLDSIKQNTDSHSLLLEEELASLGYYQKPNQTSPFAVFSDLLTTHEWCRDSRLIEVMRPILLRLCARYLYKEKRRNQALNPVANFHLGNGSELWRINFLADTSKKGMDDACGLMINYRYYPEARDDNSRNYLERHVIAASPTVISLLRED